MSDGFDSLIEGYPGLDDPDNDPGPLTDEENQRLEEEVVPAAAIAQGAELDEPPHEPDDWPDPDQDFTAAAVEEPKPRELRALRPDQVPVPGTHYVIAGGIARPVAFASTISEDEYVRSNQDDDSTVKDFDGQRRVRADRALRLRYRGFLCGEVASL